MPLDYSAERLVIMRRVGLASRAVTLGGSTRNNLLIDNGTGTVRDYRKGLGHVDEGGSGGRFDVFFHGY